MQTLTKKNNPWIALSLIMFLGLLLRLNQLGQSLWFDEVWYATAIFMKSTNQLLRNILFDKAAPFYQIFMFFWSRVFGDSELIVRIPSLLCGVLSIPLSYFIGLRLLNKQAAMLAAFLLCFSPVHIWYSQEASPYALLLFLLLASLYSYYKLEAEGKNGVWFSTYCLSLFLTIFTHWYVFPYFIAVSVVCFIRKSNVRHKVLLFNFLIFIALLTFLFVKIKFGIMLQNIVMAKKPYLRPFNFFELWLLFFNWFSSGNSLWNIQSLNPTIKMILQKPYMLFPQVIFFFIFMAGLTNIFRERKNFYRLDILLYLFLPSLSTLVLSRFVFPLIYIERYLFIVLPFFFMVLANGAVSLKSKALKITCSATLILLSCAALLGFFIKSDEWTVFRVVPDWNSAMHYFCKERQSIRGPIIIIGASPSVFYYERKFRTRLDKGRWNGAPHSIYEQVPAIPETLASRSARTFYLIEEKDFYTDDFNEALAIIIKNPRISLIDRQHFKGMEIYKFKLL